MGTLKRQAKDPKPVAKQKRSLNRWLAEGALLAGAMLFLLMMYVLNSAVETDWQEIHTDDAGHVYSLDTLVTERVDDNRVRYAVRIDYPAGKLVYKGRPVESVLERGLANCRDRILAPQRRMHLGTGQELLLMEQDLSAKDPENISMVEEAVRPILLDRLCSRDDEASAS